MSEVGILSINSQNEPTNSDINVVFSPSTNVVNYTYQVLKNNVKIIESKENSKISIPLTETGSYQISISATMKDNSVKTLRSGSYVIDKESPVISLANENIEINKKEISKIKENARAQDNFDGDLTNDIKISEINLKNYNNQIVTYTVIDKAGNMASKQLNLKITPNYTYFFVVQGIMMLSIFMILFMISKYRNAIKIENRLKPFTIKPVKDKSLSISEKVIIKYQRLTEIFSKNFSKSVVATKYCQRLEKYLPVTDIHKTKEDIFAGKIITAFVFLMIAIISKILTFKLITGAEMIIIFTFGFFVLDILYFIKYKVFRWKIESDFIAAITIMNNAFKSGRSITQAIDLVATELKGTMGEQFNRMSLELLYGLEIDVVFERFAKRIGLEEANYLTASLTILNKTGGDIIKVFNSIERNMFDKRKLRLELASLTSGSKIVVATLLGMPFFFMLVISMINKDYFLPLFTTGIGRILLIFMIIYYIIFVVVVRKIMKVVI